MKRSVGAKGLPLRTFGDDEDRPKYSKEYLQELQSSTPNTPINMDSLPADPDDMVLDPSELDGATIVEVTQKPTKQNETSILTDAEIKERKERRARLAKEENFLSVEDEEDEYSGQKKKEEGRLVADDEEFGEGFDNFVDDGGLSLGKKATKERSKRERQQIADLIGEAEGHSSDDSSASEAERRIAYEAAQTRAGMDGLKKPKKKKADEELLQVPPKITPLPSLSECLSRLKASVKNAQDDLKSKQARVDELKKEKEEISKREQEVQTLLDETGKKYRDAMGQGKTDEATVPSLGLGAELAGERGLESIGTTPRRREQEDV